MTSSGTYNFQPSLGELVLNAFSRCGIRRTSLLQEHFADATMETNLMLASWANQGVNLWEVDLISVPLVEGVTTYSAAPIDNITAISGNGTTATLTYSSTNTYPVGSPITVAGMTPTGYNGTYVVTASTSTTVSYANTTTGSLTVAGTVTGDARPTVMILDAFIRYNSGTSSQFDRVIMPISRTEYSQTPNKLLESPPTVFWFDRLISPTITVWPVPDQTGIYTLNYYRVHQIQDANLTGGQTVDIPYRWLDAMASGLAARLAAIYAPDRLQLLEAKAEQAYTIAATQDTENVGLYIVPGLSGYFRVS